MDADVKRNLVHKAILLQIKNGFTRYTQIKDIATFHCKDFASSNSIKKQLFRYLFPQGYIKRTNPGKYQLTQKGEKYLEILTVISF